MTCSEKYSEDSIGEIMAVNGEEFHSRGFRVRPWLSNNKYFTDYRRSPHRPYWQRYFKRPYQNDRTTQNVEPPPKRHALPNLNAEKNALCLIHDMYKDLQFNIVNQEGPSNAPIFTAAVKINGIIFEGKGRNKKAAKHDAAEAALKSLIQFEKPVFERSSARLVSEPMDFTKDVQDREINNFDVSKVVGKTITIPVMNGNSITAVSSIKQRLGNNVISSSSDKNAVMLLNEIEPTAKYELVSEEGDQSKKFKTVVTVKGQSFEGIGSSKKLSKAAAARSALLVCFNITVPGVPVVEVRNPFYVGLGDGNETPQLFSDHISQLVNKKFAELMTQHPTHVRRKILAGIVMSKGYDMNTCQVLAVSTGTKCINGEMISANGTVLNDSHAEIVARRCLCNFFYSELDKLLSSNTENYSIFERVDDSFRVRPEYKFHLYVTSAPCGDSRMFSPHDEHVPDKHPNRKARGLLRTKIECGEGTIPVKMEEKLQTWDGVLLGERLLTMSCSDKIAKWNVVGLQGALLSFFVDPVYLDSIVLGSLFHSSHLYRAVCGRIESTIHGLPPPYRLNKPNLSTILNPELRQVGKAPNFSVNWNLGEDDVEIVNAMTGRTEQNGISRVSKCTLFYKFLNLINKMPTVRGVTFKKGSQVYSQCKEKATAFQVAKQEMFRAFSKAQLGQWVKKPLEVDQFEWDKESLRILLYGFKEETS